MNVTQTDDNQWSTYKKFTGTFSKSLPAGQQILRVAITGPYINLDKMVLTCKTPTGIEEVSEELRVKSEEFATANWFTLDGRKLNGKPTRPGIYVRNGSKVVIN